MNNNDKPIRVGNIINPTSQCGLVFDINGVSPTICTCTHGWANGYIVVSEDAK